jgi:hypothetical protein
VPIRVINKYRRPDVPQHIQWCNEQFGLGPEINSQYLAERYRWCYQYNGFGVYVFHFQDETDYMFYLLRWS